MDTSPLYPDLPQRFWNKVDKDGPLWAGTPCWLWTASHTPAGYGKFLWQGRPAWAHRVAYMALVGPIPQGTEIDHLCRIPACVNPVHLEAVTHRENVRRGQATKKTWPACALCGDPDGKTASQNRVTPIRISGARFGITGLLCQRCHSRLYLRQTKDHASRRPPGIVLAALRQKDL